MKWPLLLLLLSGIVNADEQPCTLHEGGKYYDLNPLKQNKDYEPKTSDGHKFALNVCRSPVTETFGLKDLDAGNIGGFMRRDHGDFAIGKLNTTLSFDTNLRLTFADGSPCKSESGDTGLRASTVIEFVCDTSVFGAGAPRLVAQLPPGDSEHSCAFVFQWRTHVACPTNEPGGALGFFSFLAVFVISLLLLYLILGTLYNRFVLNLRGLDQVPQFSIEGMKYHLHEALDWMRDIAGGMRHRRAEGPLFSAGGFADSSVERGFGGGSGRSLAGGATNPVSHQTQFSASNEGGGEFVRPKLSRGASDRRADMNPVSHQSQVPTIVEPASSHEAGLDPPPPVISEQSGPPPSEQSQPPMLVPKEPLVKKNTRRPTPIDVEGTEQEFMLGDDDEDDIVSQPLARREQKEAGASETNMTAARGRDLGTEGVIHL